MSRYAAPPPAARGPLRPPKVDREKTCPSLLRVFVKNGAHHQDTDFGVSTLPTADEHQLYTWRDTTLREILLLLRDVDPSLRSTPAARFSLRLVFWDADKERFRSEELAVIAAKDLTPTSSGAGGGAHAGAPRGNYTNPRLDRTLADAKFVVGDYLSVAHLGTPAAPPVPAPVVAPVGFGGRPAGPRGGPAFGASGPQYAPPPHLRGGGPPLPTGPAGGRGGFGGAPAGPRGPPAGRRDDTWAPVQRGGGGGGRGGFNGRSADQGWGKRRPSEPEGAGDRPPPPRRRDSRSRSPARRRSPSYTRSPPPPPRRDSRDDVDMRD
ncbi:hypothetical protein JCM11251_006396 [Rhodosporidiobolus azoricus]